MKVKKKKIFKHKILNHTSRKQITNQLIPLVLFNDTIQYMQININTLKIIRKIILMDI
jgi:hypothetical protein